MTILKKEAIARMKQYLEKNTTYQDTFNSLKESDDFATCKKCGRIIYCGVNKLCNDVNCGLRNVTEER